jgi:beta-lactamase superfamily II metal-dependent hydrolase
MRSAVVTLLLVCAPFVAHAAKTLDLYFIDVEGGQATLIVTPAKEAMLIDAGWPGFSGRDAARIADAAKKAGVKKLDYLVTTHYHADHGGVPQLLEKLEVKTFIDHGPTTESSKNGVELYRTYEEAVAKGKRVQVKPGDTIPMKGFGVEVVTSNGERAPSTVKGAGNVNPLCVTNANYPEDKTENARSIGMLFTFGKFRFVDLGDLTSRKELDLACPENRIGKVDLYLTTHHGTATSNAKEIVHALQPRVAVMNNGARKGGAPEAWRVIKGTPGLEDLWQLHFAVAGGIATNSPEILIANLDERCEGRYIKVSANPDGSFTVLNSRNKYQKTYPAR